MSAEQRAYLDTSALAKWYLNEVGSEAFVDFLQGLGSAVISSLTITEMRSLLFAALIGDIDRGWLLQTPIANARFAEATNLIARYPEHPLRTLDALHLTVAADLGVSVVATADGVMANAAASMGFEVARF